MLDQAYFVDIHGAIVDLTHEMIWNGSDNGGSLLNMANFRHGEDSLEDFYYHLFI